MSIPVPVQRRVMAALNVDSTKQNAVNHDSVDLAKALQLLRRRSTGEHAPVHGEAISEEVGNVPCDLRVTPPCSD